MFQFCLQGLFFVVVLKSCLILCDPKDCSPPGSSAHRILQARILEWVAIPSPGDLPHPGIEPWSPALQADSLPSEPPGKNKVKVAQLCLALCNPRDYTVHGILQARTLEWVAIPSPGDLPNPGIEPWSPSLQADSLLSELQINPMNP